KDAARLAADTSAKGVVSRVAGATLLSGHRGDEAVTLLGQLARDKEPSVAVIAVGGLLQIDVKLLLKLVGSLRDSSDARLRGFAVEVYRREPSEQYVHLLGDLLDDADPSVRANAREALLQLAKKQQFAKQVIAEGTRMLATHEWRAQEQATILLVGLDHKPAAGRLVELLRAVRPEVFVTAAWGLRK